MHNTFLIWLAAGALAAAVTDAAAQDQAAIGEQVYEEHCQSCHGEKLRSAGAIPDLRELGESDRAKFDKMVLEGRGQMPAWQGVVIAGTRPALGLCAPPRALGDIGQT